MVRTAALRTAVLPLWIGRCLLLHCCCIAVVGWSVGGWWVAGAWWVAAHSLPEMAGGCKKNNLPAFLTGLWVLKTPEQTKRSFVAWRYATVRTAKLL